MEFITNRTSADVARASDLNRKIYAAWSAMSAVAASDALIEPMEIIEASLTDAEFAEWKAGLKGAYNYTDLNRVESAVAQLSSFLDLGLITKTDWTMDDVPTKSDMERYISNLQIVKESYAASTTLPSFAGGLTHIAANNIEKMLEFAFETMETSDAWEKYSCNARDYKLYTKVPDHPMIGTTGRGYSSVGTGSDTPLSSRLVAVTEDQYFGENRGFYAPMARWVTYPDGVGCYDASDDGCESRLVTSYERVVEDTPTDFSVYYRYKVVEYATFEDKTEYTKGDIDYGVVAIRSGELPDGTLLEGSYEAGYCCVKKDSSYYYYERRKR